MNKKEYILFIFEGTKIEPLIFENLKKYFLEKKESTVAQDIVVTYGTVIYTLYKSFFIDGVLDDDLDLVTFLKPEDKNGKKINPNQVSEIYLFFDYDGHASNADDEKILRMLNLFDNETEQGLLYISYPMVESLLHIKKDIDFSNTIASSKKEYKTIARDNCDKQYLHFNDYQIQHWNNLIHQHCQKANYIVHNRFEFPTYSIEQIKIFESQLQKYDVANNQVAVLSAFPIMLLDYYGCHVLKERIAH